MKDLYGNEMSVGDTVFWVNLDGEYASNIWTGRIVRIADSPSGTLVEADWWLINGRMEVPPVRLSARTTETFGLVKADSTQGLLQLLRG